MRFRHLSAACVAAAISVTALSIAPAAAAPVDKATFDAQFTAAAQQALSTAPPGSAIVIHMNGTQNDTDVLNMHMVQNPDGSSIGTVEMFGQTAQYRCITATKCWSKLSTEKKWSVADGADFNINPADLTGPSLTGDVSDQATYDIENNQFFIINDPAMGVTSFSVTGNVIAGGIVGSVGDSAGLEVELKIDAAATPVKVVKPPKRLIAKKPSPTSMSVGLG